MSQRVPIKVLANGIGTNFVWRDGLDKEDEYSEVWGTEK